VVKQALVTAKNDGTFASLRKNTYGLVFFAVSHQGGHEVNLGKIAKSLVTSLSGNSRNDLVESLEKIQYIRRTRQHFSDISCRINRYLRLRNQAYQSQALWVDKRIDKPLGLIVFAQRAPLILLPDYLQL